MTASIQNKNGFMYVVLCYNKNGVKKYKWVATGMREKGNKKLLKAQLDSYIDKYSYLADDIPAEDTYFVPYLQKWLSEHRNEVAKSTGGLMRSLQTLISFHILRKRISNSMISLLV